MVGGEPPTSSKDTCKNKNRNLIEEKTNVIIAKNNTLSAEIELYDYDLKIL